MPPNPSQAELFDSSPDNPDVSPHNSPFEGELLGGLSRDCVDVLFVAVCQYKPFFITDLGRIMPQIDINTESGKKYPATTVKFCLKILKSRDLISEVENSLKRVRPKIRAKILIEAFNCPEYQPRAESISKWILEERPPRLWNDNEIISREQIEVELSILLERYDAVLAQLLEGEEFRASLAFAVTELSSEQLMAMPGTLRHHAVFQYLQEASYDLLPIEQALEAVAEMAVHSNLLSAAGSVFFLQGDEVGVRTMVARIRADADKSDDDIYKLKDLANARGLEACLDFAKGNMDGAIEGFEDSIRIEKGPSRKKKFCPHFVSGIIFQLALCIRGTAKDLKRSAQIATWQSELEESVYRGFSPFGASITDCLTGEMTDANRDGLERALPGFVTNAIPNLNLLLFAILSDLAGCSEPSLTALRTRMKSMIDIAEQRKYHWLAMEAAARCSESERMKSIRAEMNLKNAVPFSDRLQAPEAWESQLKMVEAVAGKFGGKSGSSSAKTKQAARKEVIWHLQTSEHDETYFSLQPILRSVSKTGRVTKGRPIALRTLKENPEKIDGGTEQDLAMAKFVKMERTWGAREHYYIENVRALLELAGHPLIFADQEATRPITLKKGRIKVDVSEDEKGEVEVKLIPEITPKEKGAKLVKNDEGHYTIYEIPNSVSDLTKAFAGKKTLKFPGAVKSRLMNAVSALAGDVEIGAEGELVGEGDESGGDTMDFTRIDADGTVRLRLVPHQVSGGGEGLAAKLLVRPITGSDFTFSPGEGKNAIFGIQGNERIQATRDLDAEKSAADSIVAESRILTQHRGELPSPWEWEFDRPTDCLALLRDLHPLREIVAIEWPEGETIKLAGVVSAGNATVSLGGSSDWLTLSGEVKVDENLVFSMRKLLEFAAASKAGNSGFIEIGNGEFLALTDEFQRQLDDLATLAQPGKADKIKLPPLAALALEDFVNEATPVSGKKSVSKIWRDWLERFQEAREHNPNKPKTLKADLRPYQLDGYRWLSRLAKTGAGACLADDMGLGKTVQALALLLERAENGASLVIAPTSVAANWLDETLKFAPTLNPIVFGNGDRTAQLAELGKRDLVICTYGLLQREIEALKEIEWNVIVLDEAQAIKNSNTQRSKAARALQGGFRIVTTGTPVENRLSELHTLFQFVLPGFLGSWERFRKQFADPIEKDNDATARERLRRIIQPFLLRRLKSTVLRDLPSRTEINLHVDLSESETAFYEALRQRAVEQLSGGSGEDAKEAGGGGAIQILAELMRLRRACCHPVLVDKKAGADMEGSKLAAFSETLDEILAGDHKVLVFSQFVDHLKLIRAELDRKKITYQYLDGSTSKPKRKQAVDNFQRGEGDVFLISLKAGGFGLNLTAADYVIHMDPWWNPAAEDQASDRAHRIGQTRPVTIYRFITRNTIEEKIVELHHKKRDLADSLLSDSGDANARVTPQELLALIRE